MVVPVVERLPDHGENDGMTGGRERSRRRGRLLVLAGVPAIDQCLPAMSFAWAVGMYL